MKFEKLNLDAFSKEKLTGNKLRSINGGIIITTANSCNVSDVVMNDGETHFSNQSHIVCDVDS